MNKEEKKELELKSYLHLSDIDTVGVHLDTIEDIYQLLRVCHDYDNKKSRRNPLGLDVTDEKLDEIKGFLFKLKRFVLNKS